MRELLRHEQARGRRSGTAVAAHAVAPSISAAANIIGLASNDLAPDSGLLECAPPTVAATSYAPSAAYGRVTGAKRMADWHSSSECPMPPEPPKMPRLNSSTSIILHDIDSIWPGVAPQLAAAPVVAPIPPAIVTPPFVERTLELGEHPPMVYAGPFVPTGTAPPHLVEHRDNILSDKSLIMIEEAAAARDVPPMPSVPRNPDEWFEAENWWTSAGYFAHAEHLGT